MTKERKLAIQMWEEIKDAIIKAKRVSDIGNSTLIRLKAMFCFSHNLDWRFDCWLCQYVRYYDKVHGEGCQRCPLSSGSKDAIAGNNSGCVNGVYHRVANAKQRKTKLKACDEIIRILNGRLK
jgi:hypothetical protein